MAIIRQTQVIYRDPLKEPWSNIGKTICMSKKEWWESWNERVYRDIATWVRVSHWILRTSPGHIFGYLKHAFVISDISQDRQTKHMGYLDRARVTCRDAWTNPRIYTTGIFPHGPHFVIGDPEWTRVWYSSVPSRAGPTILKPLMFHCLMFVRCYCDVFVNCLGRDPELAFLAHNTSNDRTLPRDMNMEWLVLWWCRSAAWIPSEHGMPAKHVRRAASAVKCVLLFVAGCSWW